MNRGVGWRRLNRVMRWVLPVAFFVCALLAAVKSKGLSAINVVSLPGTVEPRDNVLKQLAGAGSLPDYELKLVMLDGGLKDLGARVDQSATNGITWTLPEPIAMHRVASLRLSEKDGLLSKDIAEVACSMQPADGNGYRFETQTARTLELGLMYFFFRTPIGIVILIWLLVLILGAMPSVF